MKFKRSWVNKRVKNVYHWKITKAFEMNQIKLYGRLLRWTLVFLRRLRWTYRRINGLDITYFTRMIENANLPQPYIDQQSEEKHNLQVLPLVPVVLRCGHVNILRKYTVEPLKEKNVLPRGSHNRPCEAQKRRKKRKKIVNVRAIFSFLLFQTKEYPTSQIQLKPTPKQCCWTLFGIFRATSPPERQICANLQTDHNTTCLLVSSNSSTFSNSPYLIWLP